MFSIGGNIAQVFIGPGCNACIHIVFICCAGTIRVFTQIGKAGDGIDSGEVVIQFDIIGSFAGCCLICFEEKIPACIVVGSCFGIASIDLKGAVYTAKLGYIDGVGIRTAGGYSGNLTGDGAAADSDGCFF